MGRHDQMLLEIGEDIAGYTVESFVARGGMAVVYKAVDKRLGRPVALKLIAPELASDPTFRARFTRESELAASLDHPNVLPVYQAGEFDGMLYAVLRYVDGEDLDRVIRRRGRLTPGETITIFSAVAAALDAAHERQLVHRDVKPGNVLLTGSDDQYGMNLAQRHVYLTDFGLTKRAADVTGLTTAGQFLGTIAYVAPEQIANQPVDHRADVYSLGCVLYHVLSGSAPFDRRDYVAMMWAHISSPPPLLSDAVENVPPAADAVLQSAMAKRPGARPDSCSALIGQLRDAFGLGVDAPLRLAEKRIRPTPGVRERFAGEPADDRPTIKRTGPPTGGTPAGAQPSPPTGHPNGSTPAPEAPPAPPPEPAVPAGPDSSAETTLLASPGPADAPAATGAPYYPAPPEVAPWTTGADSGPPPSLGDVLRTPSPSPEPEVAFRAEAPAAPTEKRPRPEPERDTPQTLLSHRRDPEPPRPGTRSWRIPVLAGVVVLVILLGVAAFIVLGPDDDNDSNNAATPTPTAGASVTPSATASIPASLAQPTVQKTIPVGRGPQGIAFAPDNRFVYVANSDSRTVSVVDTEELGQVATIPTRDQPQYLAINRDGTKLYVSTHNDNGTGNTVAVVDTKTRQVTKRINVGNPDQPSNPYALALSPDGALLYVPDHERSVITVIGTAQEQVLMTLGVKPKPHWVTFAPDGRSAYVADHESNLISVIDTAKTTVTATIPVGKSPHSVAVTPDGTTALTANFDVDTSSVVDLKTKNVRTVNVGKNPRCVAVSADGRHAYYAATGDGRLTVIDIKTLRRTASLAVGQEPWVVAVSPDGYTGWVSNRASNTVSVVTLAR
ncbi:protein kinase domain-containing protein [Cryptosporangium phraense]|nr:protein kinase [Cryptosporangium phraense]